MFIVYLNVSNTKLKLFLPATPVSLQGSEVKFSIFIYKFVSQPLIGINVSEKKNLLLPSSEWYPTKAKVK